MLQARLFALKSKADFLEKELPEMKMELIKVQAEKERALDKMEKSRRKDTDG